MGFKYRKKPTTVEAYHFADPEDDLTRAYPHWFIQLLATRKIYKEDDSWFIELETTSGQNAYHSLTFGDWIIKGVDGVIYPCSNSVFEQSYERMPEDGTTSQA